MSDEDRAKFERFDAQIKRGGRISMIVALAAMAIFTLIAVLRGDELSVPALLITGVWGVWVIYMLTRSTLFGRSKQR